MKLLITLTLLLSLTFNSTAGSPRANHKLWTEFLQRHVSSSGHVNYKTMLKDKNNLIDYVIELKTHTPGTDWSNDEKLAYYINLYNVYTIQFILTKYPVTSPKKIKYSSSDIWHLKLVKFGKKTITLTQLENDIIRAFGDPRIHFAINCGAKSCPPLLNRAYEAATLNTDLTKVTKAFLNNNKSNIIKPKKLQLSKIFEWYAVDFKTKETTLIDFINKYTDIEVSPKAKIEYLPYNWDLNG